MIKTRPTHSWLSLRQVVLWVMLLACIGLLLVLLPRLLATEQLAADDFVSYWSAARLNLSGGNPFSPDQVAEVQSRAGRPNVPLMMWDLPWLLALTMPFGLLPYFCARVLWFFANIGIVAACAGWLWRYYGGPEKKIWLAWAAGFTFAPALQLIKIGQVDGLFLLGLTGFLYFEKRKKWWLAGGLLSLLTFKPHLLYLVFLAVFVWSLHEKKWQVLAGAALGVFTLILIVFLVNPLALSQYLYAITHSPLNTQATASFGVGLRLWLGQEKFWLQFVPPLLGIAWFLFYWRGSRLSWSWSKQMPLLIAASMASAAYGWTYDQSVLLVPLILVVVSCSRKGWGARTAYLFLPFVAINFLMLVLDIYQSAYWWSGLGFLLWYAWALSWYRPDRQSQVGLEIAP